MERKDLNEDVKCWNDSKNMRELDKKVVKELWNSVQLLVLTQLMR